MFLLRSKDGFQLVLELAETFFEISTAMISRGRNCLRLSGLIAVMACCAGCSSVFYQPDRYLYYPPEKLGYKAREFQFTSIDGTKLIGWFFAARGKGVAKGTIVQFHGNAENISSHYTSLVWLTKRGYNLFTFDYRGYGGSEGEPTQEGVYQDGMVALDKAWSLRAGRRFIVYGQSLGGAIAMRAFKDFRGASETSLIVMDSTFVNYKTVARRVLASRWFTWPISPLACLLVSNRYGSEDAVRDLKTRLLVIHDKEDPAVSYDNGQDLYKLAEIAPKKEFWSLNDGRHIEVFAEYNKMHRERFVRLLDSL